MRKYKNITQIALECDTLDKVLDTSSLPSGWEDTIISLVEQGPLDAGDIPNKSALYDLEEQGYAARTISKGTEPEGNIYATLKGGNLFIQLVLGTYQDHTLQEAIEKRKSQSVSNESLEHILSYGFLGVLAIVGWGIPTISKWRKKRKEKKDYDQGEIGKLKKLELELSKTILNNSWLDKQTFVVGRVKVPGAEVLLVNNKLPSNILDSVEDTFRKITSFDKVLLPDYEKFVNSIIDISKPIEDIWNSFTEEKYLALTEKQKAEYVKLQKDIDNKLATLTHPMVKNINKIPDFKSIMGNLSVDVEGLKSSNGKTGLETSFKPTIEVNELPALTKDQIKYVGKIIKEIISFSINDKGALFSKTSAIVHGIPMPQDGWPYETISGVDMEDIFPELAMGTLGDLGALNEQYFDPIYSLEWGYGKILGEIQVVLTKWIEASIKE